MFLGDAFWENKQIRSLIDAMSEPAGMGDNVFAARWVAQIGEPDRTCWLLVFCQSVGIFAHTEPLEELVQPDPSHPDMIALARLRLRKQSR